MASAWIALITLLVSLTVLVISGNWMVKGLKNIAVFLRMSPFVASFVLVGLTTSLPELFVGITSSLQGIPSLSVGNVFGSNIVNLTIVAGIGILIVRGHTFKSMQLQKDAWSMFFIALLPILLMWLGSGLSRLDGVILLLVFCFYTYFLFKDERHLPKQAANKLTAKEIVLSSGLFLVSLALLFISAEYVVESAVSIAEGLGLSTLLIGLIVVSLGTSLPEISFTINSFLSHHGDLSLGNLIGSVISNITLVLGVTALIAPVTQDVFLYFISSSFMLFTCFLFATLLQSGNRLDKKEGITLLLLYGLFLVMQLFVPV